MALNNDKAEGTFKWSDEDVKIFCEICIDFIRKNGRTTSFNWKTITIDLNEKLNRNCTSKVVKNKFDAMKKDWYIWKSSLHQETGLGRNPVSGRIEASEEWWARKIKENKEARRFRNKDFSFSMEELHYEIFEGKCATEENVVAPGMDPQTENVTDVGIDEENEDGFYNTSGAEDVYSQYPGYSSRLDELENQENSFFSDFLRDVTTGSQLPLHSRAGAQAPTQNTKTHSKTTTTNSTQLKRKRRQSGGSAMLSGHMGLMVKNSNRALELMEADSISLDKSGSPNNSEVGTGDTRIQLAMNIVNRLIAESKIGKASESWCFLMHLLEDGAKRELFVYILALGISNRDAAERFQRSGATISRAFHDVLEAMSGRSKGYIGLARDVIKPTDPTFQFIPPQISNDDRYMPYFKDCIGCIDGTHIHACIPEADQLPYRGRKGVPTFNVMATCDFNMCFTFISVGWPGSAHDTRVFLHAINTPAMKFPNPPPGRYYLVDKGYPERDGYLVPYPKTRYHKSQFENEQPTNGQEAFNKLHSSLRSCIERSFGVLKKRWKILAQMPQFSVQTQIDVIMATFALHNYIRMNSQDDLIFSVLDNHPDYIPHDELPDIASYTNREHARGTSNEMNTMRDNIATLIWGDK